MEKKKPVIITGLARSGTSMMMNILKKGGVPIIQDHKRPPDEDNPKGYLEVEYPRLKVNRLRKFAALKLLSPYLYDINDLSKYTFIYMTRDLDEVVESQHKMLRRPYNTIHRMKDKALYFKHSVEVRQYLLQNKAEVIWVDYNKVLTDRYSELNKIRHLVTDFGKAIGVVDEKLYRTYISRQVKLSA